MACSHIEPDPPHFQLEYDILRMGALVSLKAILDPSGTAIAEGGLGSFAGVPPNGAFKDVLGTYLDPPLPWPGAGGLQSHESVLARQFHRAHASEWCGRFREGDPELDLKKLQRST